MGDVIPREQGVAVLLCALKEESQIIDETVRNFWSNLIIILVTVIYLSYQSNDNNTTSN